MTARVHPEDKRGLRLPFAVSPAEKDLIDRGAALVSEHISEFVRNAAKARALELVHKEKARR